MYLFISPIVECILSRVLKVNVKVAVEEMSVAGLQKEWTCQRFALLTALVTRQVLANMTTNKK